MLSRIFKILGLKEKDEQIYMTALELGMMQPASVIARVSGFKRIDVYNHLCNMVEIGIFKMHNKHGVLYFEPNDLTELKSLVKKKMMGLDEF